MKTIISFLLLLAVLPLTINLQGCREKPDEPCNDPRNKACPNYNPCLDVKETSADFTIEERVEMGTTFQYETDTVTINNTILFTLKQPYDSVTWLFNGEEFSAGHRNKSQISTSFRDPNKPDVFWQVPITCIVYNRSKSSCLPNDNGVDTITKVITIAPWYKSTFYGKYRGSLANKPDSIFDISIELIYVKRQASTGFPTDIRMNIYGLGKCDYGRDSLYSSFNDHRWYGLGYKGFIVSHDGDNQQPFCNGRYGNCFYDNTKNKLIINYWLFPERDVWYKFEGTKIN